MNKTNAEGLYCSTLLDKLELRCFLFHFLLWRCMSLIRFLRLLRIFFGGMTCSPVRLVYERSLLLYFIHYTQDKNMQIMNTMDCFTLFAKTNPPWRIRQTEPSAGGLGLCECNEAIQKKQNLSDHPNDSVFSLILLLLQLHHPKVLCLHSLA